MASQVDIDKCKKVRTTKKAAFTRKVNNFKSNVGKSFSKLRKAYEELEVAYSELGKACDEYINLVEGEVIEAEGDHMVDPSKEMSEAEDQFLDAEFAAAQGRLRSSMTQFQNDKPSELITKWCSEKSIGFSDLRKELAKVEAEYTELKQKHASVVEMNPTAADLTELAKEFKSMVVDEYSRCKGLLTCKLMFHRWCRRLVLQMSLEICLAIPTLKRKRLSYQSLVVMRVLLIRRIQFGESSGIHISWIMMKNPGPQCCLTIWISGRWSKLWVTKTIMLRPWRDWRFTMATTGKLSRLA